MICAVIKGPSLTQAFEQIKEAVKQAADLVELRLDYFNSFEGIETFINQIPLPVILTLRSQNQGGEFEGTEEERIDILKRLLVLKPAYVDYEYTTSSIFIDFIKNHYPQQRTICSYHDFVETPLDLSTILENLKKIPANIYKLALKANSSLDALRLIQFANEHRILGISMGEYGEISRILAIHDMAYWTYASLDLQSTSAPGQLTLAVCRNVYQRGQSLYGLIGDPVSQSIGHYIHNGVFKTLNISATYVKVLLKTHELAGFFSQAKNIGFCGLSVTMPHKENVIPFLNEIDLDAQKIGAVNTIVFRNECLIGTNTDGKGALNAIEKKSLVQNRKIVILGAGGAAKAIAYEAIKRKATVTILCREPGKIEKWASLIGCHTGHLEDLKEYDILINATPLHLPINPENLIPQSIVMDITTFPQETLFLKEAKSRKCVLIFGYEMFLDQAAQQLTQWFGPNQEFFELGSKVGRHFNLFT